MMRRRAQCVQSCVVYCWLCESSAVVHAYTIISVRKERCKSLPRRWLGYALGGSIPARRAVPAAYSRGHSALVASGMPRQHGWYVDGLSRHGPRESGDEKSDKQQQQQQSFHLRRAYWSIEPRDRGSVSTWCGPVAELLLWRRCDCSVFTVTQFAFRLIAPRAATQVVRQRHHRLHTAARD
jgi:hypothetical protein